MLICKRFGWPAGWFLGGAAAMVSVAIAVLWADVLARGPRLLRLAWLPSLDANLTFRLDGLGLFFAFIIASIGSLVFIYAAGYLRGAAHCGRFFAALGVFFAAMIGVALADNLLLLFVFWELTSFSSYLLIGFKHNDETARASALQALLVTSGGGLALLAGILLLADVGGSMSLSELNLRGEAIRAHALYPAILTLVLLGAFTKSAQFPFHFWLPDAMAAPTPVSAYLHSATLVKAGIFLLLRLTPILAGTGLWVHTLTWVGLGTAVLGALMALAQTDAKRMLAYATVCALGLMVMFLGSARDSRFVFATVLFLSAHAMYKGALFMVAGALDHATGTREFTRWSGLRARQPVLAFAGFGAALAMAAAPPTLAFIAKEELLTLHLEGSKGAFPMLAALLLSSATFVAVALAVGVRPFLGRRNAEFAVEHPPTTALLLGPAVLALLGIGAALHAEGVGRWLASPKPLSLWHGFGPALGLSALSLALGGVLYALLPLIRRLAHFGKPLSRLGPGTLYAISIRGLKALAAAQTRVLQNGRLTYYLQSFFVVLLAASLYPLFDAVTHHWPANVGEPARFYEILLALFIALAAFAVIRSASPFAAIASLGMVGYGVAIVFVLFGAPDLAMTQFLIETLMIVLFVLVFFRMKDVNLPVRPGYPNPLRVLAALGIGALMTLLALLTQGQEHMHPVADYFLENSYASAHGRNAVNVILVDFRAADTLGEVTVLALAAIGVRALVGAR